MGGRIIEHEPSQKLNSTNQMAVYQNKFHKSKSNLNLKNFSQIKFGESDHIQQAYEQQAANRKAMAELQRNHVKNGEISKNLAKTNLKENVFSPNRPLTR